MDPDADPTVPPARADLRAVRPDLGPAGRFVPLPFHWRWALPLWRLAFRAAAPGAVGADVTVEDRDAAGVPVRVYRPRAGASGAALLWAHGGGLILGDPRMDDGRCATFAREAGTVVVSVGYRLAPEHPFPAALDDLHTAWSWVQREAGALGVDPARVAIGGASAGGGLAACLGQRLVDEGAAPAAQLLVYPMLDDRTAARRDLDRGGHRVWSNRSNRAGWSAYLGAATGGDAVPAYAAAARRADLAGSPPTWFGVGQLDLFLEEDRAYARQLEAAGVAVEVHEVPGAPHGFDAVAPQTGPARAFVAAQAAFLRARLSGAAPRGRAEFGGPDGAEVLRRIEVVAHDGAMMREPIQIVAHDGAKMRDRIEVVAHDPAWAARFAAVRDRIAPALAGIALAVEHVGSTAVPGLPAKPIVDVDVVVADAAAAAAAIERLERLGYRHVGDRGVPGREAFERPDGTPPHHLYVCLRGSVALDNHLRLRDRLRADPELARAYGDLKRRLAAAHADDIDAYVAGKTTFITAVLREAGMAAADLEEVEAANRLP